MAQQHEATTDRLVSVIQSIQLEHQSGTLTVRRGGGITLEEGMITFVNGQVTKARVGRRTGSVALNWLSTWGYCRYTFGPPITTERTLPLLPPPANVARNLQTTDPLPSLAIQLPSRLPAIDRRTTNPLAEEHTALSSTDIATRLPAIPYRTRLPDMALRLIDRTGFSRTHRHLFLLVDGQRSTKELARLMGKSEQEIADLLDDLERASLVRVPET
jgi:hypothetical protein